MLPDDSENQKSKSRNATMSNLVGISTGWMLHNHVAFIFSKACSFNEFVYSIASFSADKLLFRTRARDYRVSVLADTDCPEN